jgi:hypothetical protein
MKTLECRYKSTISSVRKERTDGYGSREGCSLNLHRLASRDENIVHSCEVKLTAICIVDRIGRIEREGKVASDPETIAAFVKSHAPHVARSEQGEPKVGSIPDPCGRPVDSLEIHGAGWDASQSWKTFLRNHAQAIAAVDLYVVPTLTFERLFAFPVLDHGRRRPLWFEVTQHPTAEWLAQQITEAFPWSSALAYLVRDRDGPYGHGFRSRVRAMSIRDRPISSRSPWQNGYSERPVRIEGIVLTMLLCSANGISVTCSILTKNTTTRLVRTFAA